MASLIFIPKPNHPEERRPIKEQPFYHLLAENSESEYIAYVSEQNLLADETGRPLRHPQLSELFAEDENGGYKALYLQSRASSELAQPSARGTSSAAWS